VSDVKIVFDFLDVVMINDFGGVDIVVVSGMIFLLLIVFFV